MGSLDECEDYDYDNGVCLNPSCEYYNREIRGCGI